MTQTDQQNVPKLRFPGFEDHFGSLSLGEAALSPISYGVVQPGENDENGVLFVRGGDFPNGTIDALSLRRIPQIISDQYRRTQLVGGEILVSLVGYPGSCTIAGDELVGANVARQVAVIRLNPEIDPNYSFQYLRSEKGQRKLLNKVIGSAQQVINLVDLRKATITLPTLPEQRKIAGFLGAVDTKIAQLADKKRLLEDYKKGCMQQLFSQKIRFKDDTGNDFPDWEEKRLGDVFSWINTNSLSRERLTYDGGQVQNIHYGDIHTKFSANFHQDVEPVPYIKDATPEDFKPEQFCKVGDVVIADASEDHADIGKAIEIVSLGDTRMVAGLHTYIARPKAATVQTGFAGYLLRSAPMRRQIERIAQGISVLGISKGNLEKLMFFLPHPAEQRKIADFLSSLDHKIDLVGQELTHARSFKQGLLQQMFV